MENVSYYDMGYIVGYLMTVIFIVVFFAVIAYILSAIIFYNATKANGLDEIAILSWIPFINIYVLFALGSKKQTISNIKSDALKFTLIYFGLVIVSLIPFIGFLASIALVILSIYFYYRLFLRWTGDQGTSIIFVVLTFITFSIFFYIYGLMKMKKSFVAD